MSKFFTVQGRSTDIPIYVQADDARAALTKVEKVIGVFSRLAPPPIVKEIDAVDVPEDAELF